MTICTLCTYFIPDCNNCYNTTYCSSCITGFSEVTTSPGNRSCLNCTMSIDNCTDCSTSVYCTICKPGYYPGNSYSAGILGTGRNCSLCSVAIPNCLNCTSNTTCTLCSLSYVWNSTSKAC